MGAPGVTFEAVDLNRPRLSQLRTDICGFVGYAERGPADRPVKVESWRQFVDAFGPPLGFAHTGHAVRLFFENGGDVAYVMRVLDPRSAGVATVELVAGATLHAAYATIDRPTAGVAGPTARPAPTSSASPGAWGNRLAVRVAAGGLGSTTSLPDQPLDGASMRVANLAGFEVGSWVRLVQDGLPAPRLGLVHRIDVTLRELVWRQPLAGLGLDLSRPLRLETMELSLVVTLDGQELSRHADLSLHPGHSRYLVHVLAAESSVVAATVDGGLLPPLSDPASWPAPGVPHAFAGGRDGLATVTSAHLLEALEALATVDEISVLAAPDVVLVAEVDVIPLEPVVADERCTVPEALPAGVLAGVVVDVASGDPVAGARVSSTEVITRAERTDASGGFLLTGLPLGQVSVRVERSGYLTLDVTAQAFPVPLRAPHRFMLAPRVLPPVLTTDQVQVVQSAMAAQGERGLYRVALLDPPAAVLEVEALQDWRSRFDTSHAALYWPWLLASDPAGGTRAVPPSGAVAGLIARLDRLEGPQRAPANQPLRDVLAVSHPVDDATHALLNDLGVNVVRATPGRGIAPQGARTLSSDAEWRYLGVRRLVLMIAEALEEGHQWAVFEPNDATLRNAIRHSASAFLDMLWRRGAFAGATAEGSYAVKCDEENNPAAVVDAGQFVAEIGVAPVRPYEFIRLRLGRTDRVQVQE